jgi:hypothetical protein
VTLEVRSIKVIARSIQADHVHKALIGKTLQSLSLGFALQTRIRLRRF